MFDVCFLVCFIFVDILNCNFRKNVSKYLCQMEKDLLKEMGIEDSDDDEDGSSDEEEDEVNEEEVPEDPGSDEDGDDIIQVCN